MIPGSQPWTLLNHDTFFLDHIQPGSSHDPLIERLSQRIRVDQAAPRGVDDQDAGPAFAESLAIQEVIGCRSQRRV